MILFKRALHDVHSRAIQDLFVIGGIALVRLEPEELASVAQAANEFRLDYDDAYQYAVAEKYDLHIVSFDKDFDRTDRGRHEPSEVLQKL